jgi:hypothetical protein
MQREYVSSPTVCTDSVLMTAVIEAEENRDIATCDIPNGFIQTVVRTIMKISGKLVDILCEMDNWYM